MLENDFMLDCNHNKRMLFLHSCLGAFGKRLSLGILSNKANIQHYEVLYRKSVENYNTYKEITEKDKKLAELEKEISVRGIRISRLAFSDINVTNPADYGFDWEILRNQILERDDYTCRNQDARCNGPLQIHHIRPLSKGGTNKSDNLMTLCKYHHSLKHDHMR